MPPQHVKFEKQTRSPSPTSKTPSKKIRLCPVILDLLKDLGLSSDLLLDGKAYLSALDPTDPNHKNIHRYVKQSQHQSNGAVILATFKIMTNLGNMAQDHNEDPKNIGKLRKMLWHGTPACNVPKILEQGFILPKKKDDTFFGLGIYFSDNFSYSLDYCGRNAAEKGQPEVVYMFLADVMLGEVHQSYDLLPDAPTIKIQAPGSLEMKTMTVESIQGMGWRVPDPQGDQLINGCVWPLGNKIYDPTAQAQSQLHGNEFVVYNSSRVIPKFLVKIQISGQTDWAK